MKLDFAFGQSQGRPVRT